MIYPPSFFSPLRALSISKIFISLKTAYLTMVGKFFKFMMYRLLANAFASQKILPRHFYHFPKQNFPPGSYHKPRGRWKLLTNHQAAFIPPAERGGGLWCSTRKLTINYVSPRFLSNCYKSINSWTVTQPLGVGLKN